MIEASQIKVDPHAVTAIKGNQKMSWTKGGSRQNYISIRAIIRAGTTADCCQAESLRPGIQAQYLLADRGYDSQAILQTSNQAEMRLAIAPKKDRKYQRNANQD